VGERHPREGGDPGKDTGLDSRLHGNDSQFIKTFPCTGCGAKLSFRPGSRELACEFCGTANEIAADDARVEELDLQAYLQALSKGEDDFKPEDVKCEKCGAAQQLPQHHFAAKCQYCTAHIVSKGYAGRRLKPKSVVPFRVNHEHATEQFRKWLRWRWLAPNDLKRYAQKDASLAGAYLPFWTYDAQTSTHYTGARGEKRDKNTTWYSVSGEIDHFHDDVVVLASKLLPRSLQDAVERWETKSLVPYKPEFVSGFRGEAYQVNLKEGFPVAKGKIEEKIRWLIRKEIGGDSQRIDSMNTRYGSLTFKHVLMPVWISAYRYRDKTYRFLVNGQTGETSGESPLSWIKVTLLAILGLVLFYFWARYG
jgi:LSD1 subclass zinc finger protein